MEIWLKTCLLLCSYGFFKELRPSEPFLTEYLLGPQHNLTSSEVYYDVYPVWTYSYLALLILVFLLTDLLRYKPVIVFEGIGYVATWCLLLWAGGVRWMQFMEFCYGIATATEVAYYTYIYAQVASIIWNDFREAYSRALTAFGIGYLHLNWALVGELTLAAISLFDGVLLVIMGYTSEIWVGYVNYIVFRVSYQILITVASYQVAKELRADCYGLVFGINMFLALLFQSILTFIVAEWLEIEPGLQFVIYGGYFGVLALVFFFFAFYGLATLGCEGIRRAGLWERSSMEADRNEAPVGTTEAY
ncbi:Thiamine transporter 1 [Armadillidium nasatum]|uniref:Thiamine transporter 1 n=1 Tax=Armadillidium nasatum TaxID=96803 RepID=A0A5N5TJZ3_9CRUS|nr:Thiamine transporter 1 [Armadillidium nasatum]